MAPSHSSPARAAVSHGSPGLARRPKATSRLGLSRSTAWLLLIPALLLAVSSANPLPSCAAVASFALIVAVLLRPGQAPVLVFICFMQWLQGALLVLDADLRGVALHTLSSARSIEEATYLTLGWVSTLAVGAALALSGLPVARLARSDQHTLSLTRLLAAYLGWVVVVSLLSRLAPAGANQLVRALSDLRWALLFGMVVYGWSLERGRLLVAAVLFIEIALGFLSFFSEFKAPLYVLALALVSMGYRPNLRQYLALGAVFAVTLYFAVVWSAIKKDYRQGLSGGQRTQTVEVGTVEQINIFFDLLATLDAEVLDRGMENLVRRIAYVEYFGLVLDYVPRYRKHEGGRLWANAVSHVFAPRLLFADKAPLESDTTITERYTGIRFSARRGTSITIGVPAESYVDVGAQWMFAIALALGMLYGSAYRFFATRKAAGAFAPGIVVAMHLSLTSVGAAAPKVLGGYLTMVIVASLTWQFGWKAFARFVRFRPRS
jgi:hypothetical protein